MSLEHFKLKYFGLYEEPAGDSTYGITHTSTPGDFLAMPYMEGSLKLDWDTEMLDPMLGKVGVDDYDLQVLGRTKWTASFDTVLHSHGLDLDGTEAAPTTSNWALLRLLKIIFGGVSSIGPSTGNAQTQVVATGTTTTTVELTAGHVAQRGFARNGVIVCKVSSTSEQLEAREIESVSGDIVTVKEAFSAAPVTGSPVRGGVTVYPTSDPDTSAQILYQGRELSKHFGFFGGNGGVSIAIDMKGLSKLSIQLAGWGWEALANHSGITVPSYTHVQPIRSIDAPLTVPTFGDSTRTPWHPMDHKLELGIAYEDEQDGSAPNGQGIRRKRRMLGRPLVKGTITKRFEDQADITAHEARTSRSVFQQLGVLAGEGMLISVPLVQFGSPKEAAVGELDGVAVPYMARKDTTGGGTSDLDTAAVRWHFF